MGNKKPNIIRDDESGIQPLDSQTKQACTKRHYEVEYRDLPLSCPPADKRVWDAHPRVYLPIEETGQYTCPYCGAEYVLSGFKKPKT